MFRELRPTLRRLGRQPGFTVVALLTLAVGIGLNTALFSTVQGVLLEPLPYDDPDRVVRLLGTHQRLGVDRGTLSYPNFADVRERLAEEAPAESRVFEAMSAYDEWTPSLTGQGGPERLNAAAVNASFFDVLGVEPAVGRFFRPGEDEPGDTRLVVLSHGFWQSRFAGDPEVTGKTLRLDGALYEIVGVTRSDFEDPRLSGASFGRPVLWAVRTDFPRGEDFRSGRSFTAIARLAPGVSTERAQGEVDAVMASLEESFPEHNAERRMLLRPLKEDMVAPLRPALLTLLAATGLVLLIACANLANLFLARTAGRGREVAVRAALGASRSRLVGQLLTESLLLSLAGGAAGLVLAFWATDLLTALGGSGLTRVEHIGVSLPVLGFTCGISVLTGAVSGLLPALRGAGTPPHRALAAGGGRTATEGRESRRLRGTLVAAQVALAAVLLVGAGLLVKSLWGLTRVDPGIETEGVLTFGIHVSPERWPEPEDLTRFYDRLETELTALPGVETVGAVQILPLSGSFNGMRFTLSDRPEPAAGAGWSAETRATTPGFFRALGIPVLRGRGLSARDSADAAPVAVINRTFAERFWPDGDPLGHRVRIGDAEWKIVGVVGDVHQFGLDLAPEASLYLPHPQAHQTWMRRRATVVVRAARVSEVLDLVPAIRRTAAELDDAMPLTDVRPMEQVVASTLAAPRFRTWLFGSFALVALLLGALGIYGVVSYTVAQRTHEVGIRMTLGARVSQILEMLLRQGMVPVLAGLAVGVLAALALGGVLSRFLYGVTPRDPWVLSAGPLLLLLVGLLACWLPARRAARVQPVVALRAE